MRKNSVAVGDTGGSRHMYSSDIITWTTKATPENNNWKSVIWTKTLGLFIAVSTNGTNRIMVSPDGNNWTMRKAPEDNLWYALAYDDDTELVVGVASSGTHQVFTFLTVEMFWEVSGQTYLMIVCKTQGLICKQHP